MKKYISRVLIVAAISVLSSVPGFAAEPQTVVLVHGAFADGSSWSKVIPLLRAENYEVIAVQNPLSSLQDDVAATERAIEQAKGDVILVGHSWAGTVITQAGNHSKVKALVYVNAFAPASGQSTAEVSQGYAPAPGIGKLVLSDDGFLHLPATVVASDFAQDLPADVQELLTVTQGPIRAANFDEKIVNAAWLKKPGWAVVGTEDHMINPDLERYMAKNIHAQITELATSHTSMLADPKGVAQVIMDAAQSTARQ